MKKLKDFDVKNKRVLVRCDFNVPLDEKGDVYNEYRIKETLPTIQYLIKNKAKVVLMSHLGEPDGKVIESLKLDSIAEKLSKYLKVDIKKAEDCVGKELEKMSLDMEPGEVMLLENLRFHKEEKENDRAFAQKLAMLGDIYINDAFSVSHREHASVCAITDFLPSGIGFLFEKEIKVLSRVLKNPWRPLVSIIGGAKIETKTGFIKELLKESDHVLIGGKIANVILTVKGICIGRPWPEKEVADEVMGLDLTSTKLHLPVDAIISPDNTGKDYIIKAAVGKAKKEELILDIGPETIDFFSNIIKKAKMIVWSGPMGYFENPAFSLGTKEIAEAVSRNHKAYKIIGGGDTIAAVSKLKLLDKFDHVSTGGGAMLSFLSREKLPGLEALNKKD